MAAPRRLASRLNGERLRPTGVFVPLVTPFADDGSLALDALESLAMEVIRDGAGGVVALATTGEPSSLDAMEREAVVATARASVPIWARMPLAQASQTARDRALVALEGIRP